MLEVLDFALEVTETSVPPRTRRPRAEMAVLAEVDWVTAGAMAVAEVDLVEHQATEEEATVVVGISRSSCTCRLNTSTYCTILCSARLIRLRMRMCELAHQQVDRNM